MIMDAEVVGVSTLKESERILDYALFIDRGNKLNLKNVHFADEALYIAKAEGKNELVKYENYS